MLINDYIREQAESCVDAIRNGPSTHEPINDLPCATIRSIARLHIEISYLRLPRRLISRHVRDMPSKTIAGGFITRRRNRTECLHPGELMEVSQDPENWRRVPATTPRSILLVVARLAEIKLSEFSPLRELVSKVIRGDVKG